MAEVLRSGLVRVRQLREVFGLYGLSQWGKHDKSQLVVSQDVGLTVPATTTILRESRRDANSGNQRVFYHLSHGSALLMRSNSVYYATPDEWHQHGARHRPTVSWKVVEVLEVVENRHNV